jgi:hypothetical protein
MQCEDFKRSSPVAGLFFSSLSLDRFSLIMEHGVTLPAPILAVNRSKDVVHKEEENAEVLGHRALAL